MDHYIWRNGLMVRDWRYGVRIANIDAAALTHDSSNVQLITLMTRALERIKSLNGVRPVFYMNRTLRSFLRTQAVAKIAGSTLAFDNIGGKRSEEQTSELQSPMRISYSVFCLQQQTQK